MSSPLAAVALFVVTTTFAASAQAITLTGTVTWSQPKPASAISIARDKHVCGASGPIADREVAIDARGRVGGAIVFIDGIPAAKSLGPREVTFDQRNCVFVPHLAAATVGSLIILKSSDPVLHTVHISDAAGESIANYAMPVMGQEASFRVKSPGTLQLRCEAGHSWMRASLIVFDHAFFASTDERGVYAITSIVSGTHKVVAWHPDIGRVERTISVSASAKDDVRVDLSF